MVDRNPVRPRKATINHAMHLPKGARVKFDSEDDDNLHDIMIEMNGEDRLDVIAAIELSLNELRDDEDGWDPV